MEEISGRNRNMILIVNCEEETISVQCICLFSCKNMLKLFTNPVLIYYLLTCRGEETKSIIIFSPVNSMVGTSCEKVDDEVSDTSISCVLVFF